MNARIDAWLIPNGICAWDMEVAHYMNGSHSYAEDLHSVIRKFASRLNQCYFMKLDNRTKKIIKELYDDSGYFLMQNGYVVLINLLEMMPVRIDQMQEDSHNFIMTEDLVREKLLAAFCEYLRIGDTREWINESFSTAGTGNDVVKFTIGDETYNHTVNNVDHAYHSSDSTKIKTASASSNTDYYLLLSNESVGDAKNVYKSSVVYINSSGTLRGTNIDFTGTIKANTFNAASDRRLKENITLYKPEKSILDLSVYKYDFIKGAKNQIGCIAQELKEICPELVHEGEDGYLSIEENKLVYLLLEEVKKLRKEVDDLKK